jgi:thiol-disulfide isomerase/thioredoxin
METQTKILILIGLVIAAVIGWAVTQSAGPEAVTAVESDTLDEALLASSEEPMIDDIEKEMEIVIKDEPETLMKETEDNELLDESTSTEVSAAGSYLDYSPESVTNSDAENILLTFSATWCPSCRTLDKNITENLANIPTGTEIYKVDYDSNVALRQEYGVTIQHTHVLINSDGTIIKKWTGGNTLDAVLAKI